MSRTKINKKSRPRKVVVRKAPRPKTVLSPIHRDYVDQLIDPCGARPFSPYTGETGIVQRFVQDATLNSTVGHTAGFMLFCPGVNGYISYSATTSVAVGAPVFSTGPGATFLGPIASKLRSCGGCITTIPSAVSMTNMTGEVAMAVVTYGQISTASTYSVDSVFQLTNVRKVLRKAEYETKWYPGQLDSTYAPVLNSGGSAGTTTLSDPADHHAILVAWRGYPPGIGLSFRLTNIVEWTPLGNIGLAVTSAPKMGVPVHTIAAATHTAEPSWWHTHSKEIKSSLGDAGAQLLNAGIKALGELGSEAIAASAA